MACISIGERISLLESIFGRGHTDRKHVNLAVSCPICDADGRDTRTKKKLIIRLDNDMCHCWVCGWKSRSILPLIKRFGSREQFEKYRSTISACVRVDDEELDEIRRELALPHDFKLLYTLPYGDTRRAGAVKYLASRGIDWLDVELWHMGVSDQEEYKHRVIIPSFDKNGKLNFIVSRAYNNKPFRQYNNCDVERSTIVFNEFNIDWSKPVVLCEGPFDMFKCGRNSIPLLGCELSEESATFDAILVNTPDVVIALDSDMKLKTIKTASLLTLYGISVKVVDVDDDPGELSKKEFERLLTISTNWSWKEKFDRKLKTVLL